MRKFITIGDSFLDVKVEEAEPSGFYEVHITSGTNGYSMATTTLNMYGMDKEEMIEGLKNLADVASSLRFELEKA